MPTLLIMKGPAVDQRVPLPGAGGRLVLGRGRSNDVVLDDPGMLVSRRHAEIRAGASGYTVIDLDSDNGVWRCGTRVAGVALETVEPIVIGPYRLLLAEADIDPLNLVAPPHMARDRTIATPDLASPGAYVAMLIGAGILIGTIAGGIVVWLLLSTWAGPSAARAFEPGTLTAMAKPAAATRGYAPALGWPASRVDREEPA